MNPCLYCGTHMPNPRRKQCGAEECARLFKNERMRVFNARRAQDGRARAYREKRATERAAYDKANRERWYIERTCIICGNTWMTNRKDAKYCSNICYSLEQRTRIPLQRKPRAPLTRKQKAERKLAASARGNTKVRRWIAGRCVRCGDYFVSRHTHRVVGYCSFRCKEGDKRDRRRARTKSAKMTPGRRYKIFERDNWTCHICNDPVNREATVPALDAPVIDHVVALANGGDHAPSNWATAHHYCNSVKSDRMLIEVQQYPRGVY